MVSTVVGFGVMRMFDILVEDVCVIRPFWDMEEAERWLRDEPTP